MTPIRLKTAAIAACLMVSLSAVSVAWADGMPNKAQPPATPLDKAINEVENKEPPMAIAPSEQVIEQIEPQVQPAQVVEAPPPPAPEPRIIEVQKDTAFLGLSVGLYDVSRNDDRAAAFNIEYQTATKIAGVLQPLFGAMASVDGSLLGYGGVGIPFTIGESLFVMPSVSVGAYKEGAGYDLGQTLAFRGGLELAYQFEDKSRLGITGAVITNGESLDKDDRAAIVALTYTTPLDILSGAE